MAFKLITTIRRFIGTSTDTKPTTGVPIGSTFYETDTARNYIYDGTNWEIRVGGGNIGI